MFLLSSILGLPAHPLLVHAAVVLVPFAGVSLAATWWRSSWRHRFLLPILLVTAVAVVATILAANTGEPLQSTVRNAARAAGAGRPGFGEHPEQGDTARNFTLLFGLAVAGAWAIDWMHRLGSNSGSRLAVLEPLARINAQLPA